jgi:rubrerythrin
LRTSADWLRYFEQNRQSLLEIPWHAGPELTVQERLGLGRSLQEFQRGESSEGRHFLRYAEQYAAKTGDRDYVSALRLFIAEEQRHARDLGSFLAINGIPLVESTLPDRVFRILRHLLGALEMSIAVLITAEIIAEVYYTALRAATDSVILERLCEQILRDEASHVEFQAEQLANLRARRGQLLYRLTVTAQRMLFLGTCLVVWVFHRCAFKAGGQNFRRFWHSAWFHFERAFASSAAARDLCRASLSAQNARSRRLTSA